MEIEKKCSKCRTDLIIIESPLLFSQKKAIEKANCPICNCEIFEAETDGWYFIQTRENSKKAKSKICVYPMP